MCETENCAGTLIDTCEGEGRIEWDDGFMQSDPLYKADVLRDLVGEVQQAYDDALKELRDHWNQLRKEK